MTKQENLFITGEKAFQTYAAQNEPDFERSMIPKGRAKTIASRTFLDHDTNISVRSDYNRADFEYFRPSYTVPQEQKEIISMCIQAYYKVGLIRNTIDLMADFGSQGIRLQHPIASTQEFYTSWFNKVRGKAVSERFLNTLYRAGQTIVKAAYGKVSVYDERLWRKSKAQDVKLDKVKTTKREIPLKYTFIDIASIEAVGQDLAAFVGQPVLALKISPKLKVAISTARSASDKLVPEVRQMIEKIPQDIIDAINAGQQYIPLDSTKTSIYYYKKDDWLVWAYPMCYAILDDILMLNKLKLADISALDGAISNIRLWKLGIIGDSPANSILPTKTAINKLRNILANNVGGGVLDLVWGPELSFEESNSQVWRFLGADKYATTINAIYEGLGIPAPLRAGSGQSNTGNFVGLNTLIKRLEYGRDCLVEFWEKELKYIHKAMGFPGRPPQVVFDFMALADEAAEKQLLINLWDRNIISDESILELFGRLPIVEKSRVKKELSERENEIMPQKASPYHNPNAEIEYRKILLQGGAVTPAEIGVVLNERNENEKTRMEMMEETQLKIKEMDDRKQIEMKKIGTPGRPKNITETKKRKPKPTERPSTRAEFLTKFMWANSAQDQISEIVTKALLEGLGKPNMRSLSKEEFDLCEKVKFDILCGFEPFEEITAQKVHDLLVNAKGLKSVNEKIRELHSIFTLKNGRQPTINELRQIYASGYALVKN